MHESPIRHAVVAVVRRDDRVLVVKRGPAAIMSGYWSPPSGRVEAGESQEQALTRELREELGVSARPVAKVWECPTDDGTFVLHWWATEIPDVPLTIDKTEVSEVRWVTAEDFHRLDPIFDGDRRFFDDVLPHLGGAAEPA